MIAQEECENYDTTLEAVNSLIETSRTFSNIDIVSK